MRLLKTWIGSGRDSCGTMKITIPRANAYDFVETEREVFLKQTTRDQNTLLADRKDAMKGEQHNGQTTHAEP